jgi:hypothetical protein
MRLPTSYTLEANGPLSGNELAIDGVRPRSRQSLSMALGGQRSAGESFRRKAISLERPIRTGPEIERAADRARTSDTLSARLQQGALPLGQWNSGSYSRIRAERPGKDTSDRAARMRSTANLGPRIAKGEEALEVNPGRHLVRPDSSSSAA